MNCIYCDKPNTFNAEHLFPAGLGGDDKRFMLIDCVCIKCNDYFSKLEVELSRKSPSALSRSLHQTAGRKRGSRTSAPVIQTENSYLIDESGIYLDIQMLPKMGVSILPQLHVAENKVFFTATIQSELDVFLDLMSKLFENATLSTVERLDAGPEHQFRTRRYAIDQPEIFVLGEEVVGTPPKNSVWIKHAQQKSKELQDGTTINLTPRFFLHDGKSINYKSADEKSFLCDLKKVRTFIKDKGKTLAITDSVVDQPLISVEMGFNFTKTTQAIAKIGMNFLIWLAPEYSRNQEFKTIKSEILNESAHIVMRAIEKSDPFYDVVELPISDTHSMALHCFESAAGRCIILFHLKLYGGAIYEVLITQDAPVPPWAYESKFCLIYFNEHKIEMLNQVEYLTKQAQLKRGSSIKPY